MSSPYKLYNHIHLSSHQTNPSSHPASMFGLESQLDNSSLASYYRSRRVIDQVFVSAPCQLLLHITLSSEQRNKLSRLQQHNFGSL